MSTNTGICTNCKKKSEFLTDCYLSVQDGVYERLCPTCLKEDGSYCLVCGQFCSGIDSFDFIHPGYCDNCWYEIEAEQEWDEDEEDYLYDENNHP